MIHYVYKQEKGGLDIKDSVILKQVLLGKLKIRFKEEAPMKVNHC